MELDCFPKKSDVKTLTSKGSSYFRGSTTTYYPKKALLSKGIPLKWYLHYRTGSTENIEGQGRGGMWDQPLYWSAHSLCRSPGPCHFSLCGFPDLHRTFWTGRWYNRGSQISLLQRCVEVSFLESLLSSQIFIQSNVLVYTEAFAWGFRGRKNINNKIQMQLHWQYCILGAFLVASCSGKVTHGSKDYVQIIQFLQQQYMTLYESINPSITFSCFQLFVMDYVFKISLINLLWDLLFRIVASFRTSFVRSSVCWQGYKNALPHYWKKTILQPH